MDKTFKCFLLLIVSLMVFEDGITSADNSSNYMACLVSATKFYENLESFFCSGSISDLWNQSYEKCVNICTIHTQNTSCEKYHRVQAKFQFDINLPKYVYVFGNYCTTCFNVTQINITCNINVLIEKTEPCLNKMKEVDPAKIPTGPACSVGSIVGVSVAGTLFGCFVLAMVFVCVRRRFSLCAGQGKEENNPVFRLYEGLTLENPEEFGKDSPVYDVLTDKTEKAQSLQTLQH